MGWLPFGGRRRCRSAGHGAAAGASVRAPIAGSTSDFLTRLRVVNIRGFSLSGTLLGQPTSVEGATESIGRRLPGVPTLQLGWLPPRTPGNADGLRQVRDNGHNSWVADRGHQRRAEFTLRSAGRHRVLTRRPSGIWERSRSLMSAGWPLPLCTARAYDGRASEQGVDCGFATVGQLPRRGRSPAAMAPTTPVPHPQSPQKDRQVPLKIASGPA
jgi:hypothetical protein